MYQVDYDESTNDEIILSEIPLNLIMESIKSQFDNPEDYRKNDYVQKFLKKYQYSLDNLRDDEEESIYELHDKFLLFIKNIFYNVLNIGFSGIEDYNEDDQHELIHLSYKFFINNIKKNFVNFVYNIINTDRDLVLQVCEKKKDVISLNFKNEIDDEYDILVLSNLSKIIDFILSQSYTVDEFFEKCEPDSLVVEYDSWSVVPDMATLTESGTLTTWAVAEIESWSVVETQTWATTALTGEDISKEVSQRIERISKGANTNGCCGLPV